MLSTESDIVKQVYILDFDDVMQTIQHTYDRVRASRPNQPNPTARAAYFSFQQNATQAVTRLTNAKLAAQEYISALQKLGIAYDILNQQSEHLSATTLQQILPLLTKVEKAYADLNQL
jgi:hypothetical protein